jgi:hypothetical protein
MEDRLYTKKEVMTKVLEAVSEARKEEINNAFEYYILNKDEKSIKEMYLDKIDLLMAIGDSTTAQLKALKEEK